jgi:hypothetical protein
VVKKMKKDANKIHDKEYKPYRSEKKEGRKKIHENENRNIVPNEVSQIMSFLQKKSKSGPVLERIWAKNNPVEKSFSIKRFYLYQSLLKEKVGHYSNEASLKHLC